MCAQLAQRGSSQEGEFGVDSSVLCAETSALVIRHGFANGCAMNIPTELMQQNCPHSFTSLFTKHEMIPRNGPVLGVTTSPYVC